MRSLALCVLFVCVLTTSARADQFQIIPEKTARAAAEKLPVGDTIRHFCAPCGDTEFREEQLDTVQLRNTGDGFELAVNENAIDLAYVYVADNDTWRNLAMVVGEAPSDVPEFLDNISMVEASSLSALYQGSIRGDLPVFMTLYITDAYVSGTYFYPNIGTTISLDGELGDDGDFVLHESVDDNETGQFRGTMKDGGKTLTGTWQATGKPDELPFTARMIAKNVSDDSTADIAGITTTTSLVYPMFLESAYPKATALTRSVAEQVYGARTVFMANAVAGNTGDYVAEFGAPVWEYSFSIGGFLPSFLSDKLVSMSYESDEYTGGAHGLYGRHAINLMLAEQQTKALKIADFVTGADGMQKLSALVLADLKRQEASGVISGDIASLDEDDLSVFVVTPKGIRLFFNPYTVASYAEGTFEVFIPWTELGDLANMELFSE